jgi:aminoglycoside phosphotransferase (APT) family kinase protein
LESKWTKENVWVHGDVAIGNLLVKDGKLCGVIDFGTLGIGDPACDYVMAWTFFDKRSRKIFFEELGCDKGARNLARG